MLVTYPPEFVDLGVSHRVYRFPQAEVRYWRGKHLSVMWNRHELSRRFNEHMQRTMEPVAVDNYHRESRKSPGFYRFWVAHHGKDNEEVIPSGRMEDDKAGIQPQKAAYPGDDLQGELTWLRAHADGG